MTRDDQTDVDHYYVFVRRRGFLYYERTCGAEHGVAWRVEELRARGDEALYLRNELPEERRFY